MSRSAPVRRLNSMVARWLAAPSEEMAMLQSRGFALAAATTSCTVFSGRWPLITMTSGAWAVRAITSRSRCGSNLAPFSTSGITAVLKAEASSV